MARRRKGKKGYRRKTKKLSIGEHGGMALGGLWSYDRLKNHTASGAAAKILGGVELLTGAKISADGTYGGWDYKTLKYFWGPVVVGAVGSKVARKVPVVNRIPGKIPIIGKYIRW